MITPILLATLLAQTSTYFDPSIQGAVDPPCEAEPHHAWSGPRLTGPRMRAVSAVTGPSGLVELLGWGVDGALWHASEQGGFAAWTSLGGQLTSPAAAIFDATGRLDVFVRGAGGLLNLRSRAPGGGWLGWESRGGVITTAPVVGRNWYGLSEVFARGTDGQLYHQYQYGAGAGYSGWEGLGGALSDAPLGAITTTDGRIEIYARGASGSLLRLAQTGMWWWPWGSWQDLGGLMVGGPAPALNGDGRLDVLVRGTDDRLYTQWQTSPGGGFAGFAGLDGELRGPPRALLDSAGFIHAIAVGPRGTLVHRKEVFEPNRPWGEWQDLQVAATSAELALSGSGALYAIAVDAAGVVRIATDPARVGRAGEACALDGACAEGSCGTGRQCLLTPRDGGLARPLDFGFGAMKLGGVPATGERPLLLVYVHDTQASIPEATQRRFARWTAGTAFPNVRDYFNEVSNGRFRWAFHRSVHIVQADQPTGQDDREDRSALVRRVIETGLDFSIYDRNRDHRIDTEELAIVFVDGRIANGNFGNNRTPSPMCWEDQHEIDVCATVVSVGLMASFNMLTHELVHQLGAVDLYNWVGGHSGISVMGLSSGDGGETTWYLDPWHRMQLGWVEPRVHTTWDTFEAELLAPQVMPDASSTSDEAPIILYDPSRGTGEFFMLEYRAMLAGDQSYDRNVASDGIALWRIQQDPATKVPGSILSGAGNGAYTIFHLGYPGFTRGSGATWGAAIEGLQWADQTPVQPATFGIYTLAGGGSPTRGNATPRVRIRRGEPAPLVSGNTSVCTRLTPVASASFEAWNGDWADAVWFREGGRVWAGVAQAWGGTNAAEEWSNGRRGSAPTGVREAAVTAQVEVPYRGDRYDAGGPLTSAPSPVLVGSGVSSANAFDPSTLPPTAPSTYAPLGEWELSVATQYLSNGARLQLWQDCQGYRVRYLRLASDGTPRADVMLRRTVR